MPELPEVENLRRGLETRILGQKILSVEVKKPKLVSGRGNIRFASSERTKEFISGLTGETISQINRRAKNLIFKTRAGKILLVHLKMSGQFVYVEKGKNVVDGGHPIELSEHKLPNKHSHVIFELSKGTLFYNDTRMFGYLLFYKNEKDLEKENHFAALGREPFDKNFTEKHLGDSLRARKKKLKTVLMGQEIVVGLGNIYADEVCFMAKVRPTRETNKLSSKEIKEIFKAIKIILKRATNLGGSSVATYRLADGSRGNYARKHKVYGKTGEKCSVCKKPLKTITLGGRTTVYCPNCQK